MHWHPDIAERLARDRQRELLAEAAAERLLARPPPAWSRLGRPDLRGLRMWLRWAFGRRSLA